jgi:hypothetical protein
VRFLKNLDPKRLSTKEMWTVFQYNTQNPVNMTGIVALLYPHRKEKKSLTENVELYITGLYAVGYTSFVQFVEKLNVSK